MAARIIVKTNSPVDVIFTSKDLVLSFINLILFFFKKLVSM